MGQKVYNQKVTSDQIWRSATTEQKVKVRIQERGKVFYSYIEKSPCSEYAPAESNLPTRLFLAYFERVK